MPLKSLFFSCFLVFVASAGNAQGTVFISQGKIEYERRVNQYAKLDADNAWSDFEKKTMAKFKTSYFDLLFNGNKSLYKPGRESPDKVNEFGWDLPAQDNTIFSDLETNHGIAQKKVFEQVFLVQDSLRQIKWKITDETKVIAGFTCRRANAIVMDSIYVVAFYTDEILATGGPESFTGLPGMILGVSLPHEHITWFATKVEMTPVSESALLPPVKGKKLDVAALTQTLQTTLKQWGKQGRTFIVSVLL